MRREWPLVAFTILGQAAVGLFWGFHLPFLVRGRVPAYGWRMSWLAVLSVVVLLAVLAAAVSFFHLHHWLRARRALRNLRSSWLSREILFELAFIALAAGNALSGGFLNLGRGARWSLLAAAGLAGALFLLSMVKLYMLPSVPAWKGAYTPMAFLAATLLLGAVSTELVVRAAAGPGVFEIGLMPVILVLLAVEIALAVIATPREGLKGCRPTPSLRPDEAPPRLLHRARIALFAAAMIWAVIDIGSGGNAITNEPGASPALLLVFLFALAGEIAGRFQFYGFVRRPGD